MKKTVKMLLYKVNEKPVEVNVSGLDDMYKYIECTYIDSSILFSYSTGERIVVWVDDEGLLVNKPINKGFAGNILIGRVNNEGFDIDLSDADIKEIKEYFEKTETSNSDIIDSYINNYMSEPFIRHFEFNSGKAFFNIGVSHLDIFKTFKQTDDKKMISLIEEGIVGIMIGMINETEFLNLWAEIIANQIFENRKKNAFGF